ncbi:hypothetical protein [Luteolibacter sp. AS25]|uniref:hypothetical protein n=1 Tax=Luteolibacter sp. AS25 TaxID=3135776 RepID=UPI00398AE399
MSCDGFEVEDCAVVPRAVVLKTRSGVVPAPDKNLEIAGPDILEALAAVDYPAAECSRSLGGGSVAVALKTRSGVVPAPDKNQEIAGQDIPEASAAMAYPAAECSRSLGGGSVDDGFENKERRRSGAG